MRQEKLLLEKQEETLRLREQQLLQEKVRQEKLREEQRLLREQEEAIRKRQEEISKELMEELNVADDITVCPALEGQVSMHLTFFTSAIKKARVFCRPSISSII